MANFFIVDVGHGNSAILEDEGKIIIFDAGPGIKLMEFLLDRGFTNIDTLFLSHSDQDHIGGAIAILASNLFQVNQIGLNSDSIKKTKIWNDLIITLNNCFHDKKTKIIPSVTTNDSSKFNVGKIDIKILAPMPTLALKGVGSNDLSGRKISSNSLSIVTLLCYESYGIIIFPGDLDGTGLINLIESKNKSQAKLLIYPHHGGNPGNTSIKYFVEELCNLIVPEFIVFSIRNNISDFPRNEVLDNIFNHSEVIKLYTTQSSEIFNEFIRKNKLTYSRDNVGTISIHNIEDKFEISFSNV